MNDLHNWIRWGGDESLASAGIPGIKYFDSSGAGHKKGTYNLVVFDTDSIIEVKRDGEVTYSKPPVKKHEASKGTIIEALTKYVTEALQ